MTKRSNNMRREKQAKFAGNGLSKTAMIFKIATVACHELTTVLNTKLQEIFMMNKNK